MFAAKVSNSTSKTPATVIKASNELVIACANGTSISLTEIQVEGSKRMSAKDYLVGHKINEGISLE